MLHRQQQEAEQRAAAVVIGDLSQRQMVKKKKQQDEEETPQERKKRRIRNRAVYNDWGLYGFVQMLAYKCLLSGKEFSIINERDTSKTCHVCKRKKTRPCGYGRIAVGIVV